MWGLGFSLFFFLNRWTFTCFQNQTYIKKVYIGKPHSQPFPQLYSIVFHSLISKGRFFGERFWRLELSERKALVDRHLEAAGDTAESASKRAKDRKWGTFHWLGNSSWSLRKEFIPLASSGKLWIKCLGREKPVSGIHLFYSFNKYVLSPCSVSGLVLRLWGA